MKDELIGAAAGLAWWWRAPRPSPGSSAAVLVVDSCSPNDRFSPVVSGCVGVAWVVSVVLRGKTQMDVVEEREIRRLC